MQFEECTIDLLIYREDHYCCQVIIQRRSSRVFLCSLKSASSICLYVQKVNIAVQLLFKEEEAEYLDAD